jgi:Tfp pilus assembly protein PilO
MTDAIRKATQKNIDFWWSISIGLLIFSIIILIVNILVYNGYFQDNITEITNDDTKINNIFKPPN